MLINKSLNVYLGQLGSDSPTPGGGSASALVASLGISLILMVVRISQKKLSGKEKRALTKSARYLKKILKDTKQVIDLDVKIYEALIKAYKSPKKSAKTTELALANSFRLQADLAFLIALAKETLPQVSKYAKGSIKNDLVVAKGFLDGAFRGAVSTANINLVYMKSGKKKHFERALSSLEKKYRAL